MFSYSYIGILFATARNTNSRADGYKSCWKRCLKNIRAISQIFLGFI